MDSSYVEAVLTAKPNADRHVIETWLEHRKLAALPMQAGMLVTGSKDQFESIFGIRLDQTTLPVALPVPPELRGEIESFQIPAPPHYH
jgi:hypothetical protein